MFTNTTKTKEYTKQFLQKIRLRYLNHRDIVQFSKSASFSLYNANYDQLQSRIIYNIHALEKGLSRRNNQRLGFGKNALKDLNDALVIYEKNNYSKSEFPYMQGCAILQKYQQYHQAKNFNIDFLKEIVNQEFLEADCKDARNGFKSITKKEKIHNYSKNFFEICEGRTSIRDFDGTPVSKDKIVDVLKHASKTPSVCNRQGWRVYCVRNKDIIKKLLKLQHGFSGYTLPEYVLAIMVTNGAFLSPVERNEAYVDGGLFSMSVLYGLEQVGLAAVPLNAMMNSKQEKAMRLLLKPNYSERFIMFIAVGNFPNNAVSPVSSRIPMEKFTRFIE